MTRENDTSGTSVSERDIVSPQRRRLLENAAAAVPLIATLPSGAAFANASTSQCLVGNLRDTQDGTIDRAKIAADEYVRVLGCQVSVFVVNPQGPVKNPYYAKKVLGGCPGITGSRITDRTLWFDADGAQIPPGGPVFIINGPRDRNLLQIYLADDPLAPTAVSDPYSPDNYYPKIVISDDARNTGLSATCLCSVNPGLDPGGICA